VAGEYREVARRAGRRFVPVYLSCGLEANLERVASVDRVRSGTGKLTDVDLLRRLRETGELFRFADCDCRALAVDTTDASPDETAGRIWAFLGVGTCNCRDVAALRV
jgi:hypothetical protein